MGVKGDKWRGGWTPQYADNHNKIFGKKKEKINMSKGTPEQYLEMFLSEQIMPKEWYRILKERSDVNELYQRYLEKRNVEHKTSN